MQIHEQSKTKVTTETAKIQYSVEFDLVELFYRLMEKLKYIILAAVICATIAGVWVNHFVTPMYTATSKLYVLNTNDSVLNLSDLQLGNYLAADYMDVFSNWHVHERVIERLDLPYSYSQISSMISVSNLEGTRIIAISATTDTPELSKSIADAYASVVSEFIAERMRTDRPTLLQEALLPSYPSSPNKSRTIVLGFLAGMLTVCGIVAVQMKFDDKIRSSEEMKKYFNVPTLGMIVLQSKAAGKKKIRSGDKI